MKGLFSFIVKALPFTVGLIISLTALSFLVTFTDSGSFEDFVAFILLSVAGIPTLLFGINKLSNANHI